MGQVKKAGLVVTYFKNVLAGITTVIAGMRVTLRELLWRPAVTVQYPEEKPEIKARFRGMLFVDLNKCFACKNCEKACPVECILVEAEGKGKDRRASTFTIDFGKCMWCGLCVEACSTDAIYTTHRYEDVFRDRKDLVVDFLEANKRGVIPDPLAEVKAAQREREKEEKAKAAAVKAAAAAAKKPEVKAPPVGSVPASLAKPDEEGRTDTECGGDS